MRKCEMIRSLHEAKQGRIRGYPSRVRVGKGSDKKKLIKNLGRGSNTKKAR